MVVVVVSGNKSSGSPPASNPGNDGMNPAGAVVSIVVGVCSYVIL